MTARGGRTSVLVWLAIFTMSTCAFLSILWLTPFGMSATGDSASYVGAARNVASGRGISRPTGGGAVKPLTHFPPLYPLTLAVFETLGMDSIDAARWLGASLFAANVLLMGISVKAATGSGLGAVAGSFFILLSPIMIRLHVWILSEPLYLAALSIAFLLVGRFAATRDRRFLVAGGAIVGMACATRYVGIAVVGAAGLVVLWTGRGEWRRSIRDTAVLLLLGMGPIIAWSVRNLIVAGTATNRHLIWHPFPVSYLKRPFSIVWEWLLPFKFSYAALYAMIALCVIVLAVAAYRRWTDRKRATPLRDPVALSSPGLVTLHGLHILVYTALLVVSISLLDVSTPIDDRTTAPLYIGFLTLGMVAGVQAWRSPARKVWTRAILVMLALLVTASYAYQDVPLIGQLRRDASGYAAQSSRESPTIHAMLDLPPGTLLYTNEPEQVYFVSGRGAYMIPIKIDVVTGRASPSFAQKLEEMREDLLAGDAALVLFRTIEARPDLASPQDMVGGLTVLFAGNDGQILVGPSFPDE
jgi:4-amino-4-deoxy-L-arabinose transferase-like glycosyltransferase